MKIDLLLQVITDFTASEVWLYWFRFRYGFNNLKTRDKTLDSSEEDFSFVALLVIVCTELFYFVYPLILWLMSGMVNMVYRLSKHHALMPCANLSSMQRPLVIWFIASIIKTGFTPILQVCFQLSNVGGWLVSYKCFV